MLFTKFVIILCFLHFYFFNFNAYINVHGRIVFRVPINENYFHISYTFNSLWLFVILLAFPSMQTIDTAVSLLYPRCM